jgi:hypothetical protein
MKALMGRVVKQIRKDPQGRNELMRFIRSGYKTGIITLSNGDTYSVVPSYSKEYENIVEKELHLIEGKS